MFRLLVAVASFIYVWGTPIQKVNGSHLPGGRIVGGHDADIADYPYLLLLIVGDFGPSCGAALIAPNWALTATHCTDEVKDTDLSVRAGSSLRNADDGQIVNVSRVIRHKDFDNDSGENDIALLELSSNVTLATPIAIASTSPEAGQIAVISGWGTLSEDDTLKGSDVLQAVDVPIISHIACKATYANQGQIITDTMICAGDLWQGGIDSCAGDSGGPLVLDGVLSGIISWGTGCAEPLYPGVYTDVSYFRDWIEENTGMSLE